MSRGGDRRPSYNAIRVCVPGCATGEEAYTIAILLLEEASRHELRPPIQIFGSDLDTRALAIARSGRYPTPIEADVNEERLRRFFIREADHYRVRQELRDREGERLVMAGKDGRGRYAGGYAHATCVI